MADLVIIVQDISNTETDGKIVVQGLARTADMPQGELSVPFYAELGWNATSALMNHQIMNAAIAAVVGTGKSVGANDNKKLFGGAGGL